MPWEVAHHIQMFQWIGQKGVTRETACEAETESKCGNHPMGHPSERAESESEIAQSCPTLCDPMDCSLSGSSIHGIFQARHWSGLPEYWSGLQFPSSGNLPDPGIEPRRGSFLLGMIRT